MANAIDYLLNTECMNAIELIPTPAHNATHVPLDTLFSWTAINEAVGYDIYLGTNFHDVNEASRDYPLDVLVNIGQGATSYDAGGLLPKTTYYWRVDEVNAPPDIVLSLEATVLLIVVSSLPLAVSSAAVKSTTGLTVIVTVCVAVSPEATSVTV